MKRKIIIATHHQMAEGLKKTLCFIGQDVAKDIETLSAYIDGQPIDIKISELMNVEEDVEVIIITDMMAGSVNQSFLKYIYRLHTHLITGVNLPLALAILMEPKTDYIKPERLEELIAEARNELIYMNKTDVIMDEEDE